VYNQANKDKLQNLLMQKMQANTIIAQPIVINDEDLKNWPENWDNLPSTFSTMVRISKKNGETKILLDSATGSSAINLFGRFAYADEKISNYIRQIAEKEKELNPEVLLAEIVHLPESRTGNILARPVFRDYEIPYLTQSTLAHENVILIEDILISVKNDKLYLRSKLLDKEIIPCLSNAHNFTHNSLPLYHFLADMQFQNKRGLIFSWGILEEALDYTPRVEYENIIFALARWRIRKSEIQSLLKICDDNLLLAEMKEFKDKRNIPNNVVLIDSDNELYINLENISLIKVLLSLVKNRSSFILKEFFFNVDEEFVTDIDSKNYANEFIFSFYKKE
jgi:hypothetical protein